MLRDDHRRDSADHLLCLRWSAWYHSRRLYIPPPPKNLLAKMRIPDPTVLDGPDAPCAQELNFLNKAIEAQPPGKLKQRFFCYYLHCIPVPALLDHFQLSRAGLMSGIERFRSRAITDQKALIAGRSIEDRVVTLSAFRRTLAERCNEVRRLNADNANAYKPDAEAYKNAEIY
ncbi:hypothetical protein AB3X94_37345 [Paraburkholderia sp. BR10923]|uniref:hypothetical protein n=1 Tax=Paraburkholderia sp. BR10923 TaxID=3236992 RepID=UPI0034CF7B2D